MDGYGGIDGWREKRRWSVAHERMPLPRGAYQYFGLRLHWRIDTKSATHGPSPNISHPILSNHPLTLYVSLSITFSKIFFFSVCNSFNLTVFRRIFLSKNQPNNDLHSKILKWNKQNEQIHKKIRPLDSKCFSFEMNAIGYSQEGKYEQWRWIYYSFLQCRWKKCEIKYHRTYNIETNGDQ